MPSEKDSYRFLIENLPDAFAYHQIVTADDGTPVDYILLDVNAAFEEMTGLKQEKIAGKKVTEILPDIKKSEFDWIGTYGKVALSGEPARFESYFEPLDRWYDISAYSDEPGYFIVIFRDITANKQTEEALLVSKELYLKMFEKAPICYQSLDENGNFLMVNQAWLDTLGYRKEEVLGKWFGDFISPEYVEAFKERFPAFKKAGQTEAEFVIIHQSGRRILTSFKGSIGYKADGSFERTHCIFQDITELKEAEEALRERNLTIQDILDNIPDNGAVYQFVQRADGNYDIPFMSNSAVNIFEKPIEDLQNPARLFEEIPSDDLPAMWSSIEQSAQDIKPWKYDFRIITKTSEQKWIRAISNPRQLDDGSISWTGMLLDITQTRKLQEELHKSEEKLSDILNNMNDVVWSISWPDFRHQYYSPALEKLYGRSPQEFQANPALFKEVTHPEDQHLTDIAIEQLLANGEAVRECRIIRPDGNIIWVNDRSKMIYDENQQPIRVDGLSQDITERKKIEEALRQQARERAAVDTFTYSVSNDLQAPLRRIEGFSELLLEECSDQLNEQARDYLNRIITQISSMKALTDALLQLSNVVTREIDRETVDLSALVSAHLEKLQLRESTRQVETIVAPNLTVTGEVDLINLIVVNLLDNAWKFTSRVKKARIEFGSTLQNGHTVYYLKDNGAGFDMKHAASLFAPFSKLHRVEDYPGIGIGLNLAFRIISRHGGEIWAVGEEGKGACFYFTL